MIESGCVILVFEHRFTVIRKVQPNSDDNTNMKLILCYLSDRVELLIYPAGNARRRVKSLDMTLQ